MRKLIQLIAASTLVMLTFGTFSTALATHEGFDSAHEFADPAFENRWERLDRPVAEFGVDRTWWWGPDPFSEGMMEEYADSPGGTRLVQYFDKSRMEIINPEGNPDELWYVTNGLLVVELITGNMQVGHAEFIDAEPANVPVAGDPDNPFGPTYATLQPRLDDPPLDQNALINERINRDGTVTEEPALDDYQIGIGTYVPDTNHTVAAPFWEIMTANGTIYQNGQLTNGPIFQNPFYAVGFPITEPYWSTAVVGGVEQDVLLQCFERRCLTYTPGNEVGWQVEAGNVGQHYYRWRYGDGGAPVTQTVDTFFVLIGDAGQNGQLIGCDDSLVPVEMDIEASDDTATVVERALTALFGADQQEIEDQGLYDGLARSTLSVESVTMNDGEAVVAITGTVQVGGICDEPRFVEQIRQTVLAVDGVSSATITVNGTPLDELFGGPGGETETVQIHLVALGDAGQNGQPIGCDDSLIPVDVEIQATDELATRIERTLMALFGIDEEYYGQSGLYNALHQSNLTVESVTMADGEAVVEITGDVQIGGVCDEPRVVEQIRQTVLGFEGVSSATITINGTPLDDFFGDGGEGAVQLYFVVLGGDGEGDTFGCGDSLAPIDVAIDPTDDRATLVQRTLEALFSVGGDTYDTDLYNALSQSDLSVESVAVAGSSAFVSITGDVSIGGACDEPRFERQIRQTVLALTGIDDVNILLNGEPLDEYFGPPDQDTETVQLYFVALEDNGANGRLIGCNDSLVPVEVEIEATGDSGERVLRTLNALLETEGQTIEGPNGMELYNALASSDLSAVAVDLTSGLATAELTGDVSVSGECDEPRFIEQIRQTILQFDSVQMTNVLLNGELLNGYFGDDQLDEGVLATFSVNGQLFNLWSTNQDAIDQILALDAGTSDASIPNGPIHRGPGAANHNTPWSWHLDPEMTEMAEAAIEVCDGTPSYVEANLDSFVDDVGQYCPWSAELVHVVELTQNGSM